MQTDGQRRMHTTFLLHEESGARKVQNLGEESGGRKDRLKLSHLIKHDATTSPWLLTFGPRTRSLCPGTQIYGAGAGSCHFSLTYRDSFDLIIITPSHDCILLCSRGVVCYMLNPDHKQPGPLIAAIFSLNKHQTTCFVPISRPH